MNLYDIKYGHEVGLVDGDKIASRWGRSFSIEGYAVVDDDDDVVGTFVDGEFFNRYGQHMATVRGQLQ